MISSHVAHDCQVGNNVIVANNVPLGGHAIIEDNVVITSDGYRILGPHIPRTINEIEDVMA